MVHTSDEHPCAWEDGKIALPSDQSTTSSEGPDDVPPPAKMVPEIGNPSQLLKIFRTGIFISMRFSSSLYLMVHRAASKFFSGTPAPPVLERPRKRLTSDMMDSSPNMASLVAKTLPTPPAFPEDRIPNEGLTITFGPCANLMIYLGGVCYCLQRMPNYKRVAPRFRFYGVSCGAIMASMMAADVDMSDQIASMWSWTEKFKNRLWGLIGAYSASVAPIIQKIFSDPEHFERARTRLSVGVTAFTPAPRHVVVGDFDSPKELVSSVLGSCYIPIAFESPQWTQQLGPVWDGGIMGFAVDGDVVVSPYPHSLPDIGPEEAHPRSLVFFPPHKSDALCLFEDGFNDCCRWLAAGAPTRQELRRQQLTMQAGLGPLLMEARRFFTDVVLGKSKQ